jgi:hypothetical protein
VLSCPACGCFLPGHRVLKVLFLASLVVLALALIVFMGFLWLAATD